MDNEGCRSMLETNKIYLGDALELFKELDDNSIDAIVTDPPYGLGFMDKEWDKLDGKKLYSFTLKWSKEALRVLKPGGHLLCFGGSRTYHRIACGIEDAGFEIRDQMQWIYGEGFPKSYNIRKGIDKYLKQGNASWNQEKYKITEEQAKQWKGWGTALKPAHEPIVVARKPLSERNIVLNVLKWGTGGININGCRIPYKTGEKPRPFQYKKRSTIVYGNCDRKDNPKDRKINSLGRFPTNIILDEQAGKILDEHSGLIGASRFFYCAKASRTERERGLENLNDKEIKNTHPTVKPIKLMRYLVRLVTPPHGLVLDPFIGSGTTAIACYLEGFNFIGFEKEKEYYEIANARIEYYMKQTKLNMR